MADARLRVGLDANVLMGGRIVHLAEPVTDALSLYLRWRSQRYQVHPPTCS